MLPGGRDRPGAITSGDGTLVVACTVTLGPDHLAVWAYASDVAVVGTAWDLVQRQRDAPGPAEGVQLGRVLISYALGTTGRGLQQPPLPAGLRRYSPGCACSPLMPFAASASSAEMSSAMASTRRRLAEGITTPPALSM